MTCQILDWLPGYMYCNNTLKSTGAAVPPTQHLDPTTGEVMFYVRPFFVDGPTVGLYIRHNGIKRAIAEGQA